MFLRKLTVDFHPDGLIVKDILEPGRIVVVDLQAWVDRSQKVAQVIFEKPLKECDSFERAQVTHDTAVAFLHERSRA